MGHKKPPLWRTCEYLRRWLEVPHTPESLEGFAALLESRIAACWGQVSSVLPSVGCRQPRRLARPGKRGFLLVLWTREDRFPVRGDAAGWLGNT